MKKNMNFETALSQLENIVEHLENGVDDLDKIVKLFEEGTSLIKYCEEKLVNVENKVEILTEKLNNKIEKNRGSDD